MLFVLAFNTSNFSGGAASRRGRLRQTDKRFTKMLALYFLFCGVLANVYAVFLAVVWVLSLIVKDEKNAAPLPSLPKHNGELTAEITRKTKNGVIFKAEASEDGLTWDKIEYLTRVGDDTQTT